MKKIFGTILILSAIAHAETYNFKADPTKGKVTFRAIGKPAFLKINGEGEGPGGTVNITDNSLDAQLSMRLTTLNTGIDLRDEHMKEKYLKVKEYPVSTLKLEKLSLKAPFDSQKGSLGNGDLKGKLTLNGVTKDVSGKFKTTKEGSSPAVQSEFRIKLSDFNIEIPEYAGIKVADDVDVEVMTVLIADGVPALAR